MAAIFFQFPITGVHMRVTLSRLRAVCLLVFLSGSAHAADVLEFTSLQPLPVETYRNTSKRLEFSVRNVSAETIRIHSIFPRKGKGSGEAIPPVLEAGATGRIVLDYTFPDSLGKNLVNFLVKTDARGPEKTIPMPVSYFILSAYEPEYPVIDFGEVYPGLKLQSSIQIGTHDVPTLKIQRIVSKPDWVDLVLASTDSGSQQGTKIVATMKQLPPFGVASDEIVLMTNVVDEPEIRIPVIARVFSKYRAAPIPVSLGGVHDGEDKHASVRINRIGAGEVRIAGIKAGHRSLATKTTPCGSGCVDVDITFDSIQSRRGLRSSLQIDFEDDDVPLIIQVDALVVPVGVAISELGNLEDITVKSTTRILGEQP